MPATAPTASAPLTTAPAAAAAATASSTTAGGVGHELERSVATIVVAFAADPVLRWLYPDGAGYLANLPVLVRHLAGPAVASDTVDLAPGGSGAALWNPPGSELAEDEVTALLFDTIDMRRHDQLLSFLEQATEHHLDAPHWYLPFIGVDPWMHGRGVGRALLRHGLARCDRDGLPAYLEASSPRNRALYERHGFEVVAEIRVGEAPPLWPMLRRARP